MPSLKEYRIRIQSVKNTQQITRAMKMVSAAKLRRAQDQILNMRPYAKKLLSVIADIAVTQRVAHPLLGRSENPRRILLLVLTSDRGLCGGFNANIQRFAERYFRESRQRYDVMDVIFIGRKASDYFKRRGVPGIDTILNLAKDVSYSLAEKIAERAKEAFLTGGYDEVRLIYNEFKSAIQQNVVIETLLPIDATGAAVGSTGVRFSKDLIFEPAPELMIEDLLKKHFATQVYRCMCESVAAEHGARMNAMENATNNAKELIRTMTLTYNNLRQASITRELIEICSGAEAQKG
jgi:F-type H+-transporting ATPase subunit gamma